MRLVAVLGVVGREVDIPATVDGMQFRCPQVGGVWLVWGRTPDYVLLALLLKVEE